MWFIIGLASLKYLLFESSILEILSCKPSRGYHTTNLLPKVHPCERFSDLTCVYGSPRVFRLQIKIKIRHQAQLRAIWCRLADVVKSFQSFFNWHLLNQNLRPFLKLINEACLALKASVLVTSLASKVWSIVIALSVALYTVLLSSVKAQLLHLCSLIKKVLLILLRNTFKQVRLQLVKTAMEACLFINLVLIEWKQRLNTIESMCFLPPFIVNLIPHCLQIILINFLLQADQFVSEFIPLFFVAASLLFFDSLEVF